MSEQKLSAIFSFPRTIEELQYQIQLDELYSNGIVDEHKNNGWFMPPNGNSTPWGDPSDDFNRNLITLGGITKLDVLEKIFKISGKGISESVLVKQLGENANVEVEKYFQNKLVKNFFKQYPHLEKIFEKYCCQKFTYFLISYINRFLPEYSSLFAVGSKEIKANFRISNGELFADVLYPELKLIVPEKGQIFELLNKTIISYKFVENGIQLVKVSTDSGIIELMLKGVKYPLVQHFSFLDFTSVTENSKNAVSDFYYGLYILLNKFINSTADSKVKSSFQEIYNNIFNKENTTADAWIDCANQIIILATYQLNYAVNAEKEFDLLALLSFGFELQDIISNSRKDKSSPAILDKKETPYLVSEFWNIAKALGLPSLKENEVNEFASNIVLLAKRKAIDESSKGYPLLLQSIGEKLFAKTQNISAENKRVKASQNDIYQQYVEELINQYKTVYTAAEVSVDNNNGKITESLKRFSKFLGKNSNIKQTNNELSIMYLYGCKLKQTGSDYKNFLQEYSLSQSHRIYNKFSFEDLLLLAPCPEIVLPAINIPKYNKSIIKLVKDRNTNQKNSAPVTKAFENILSSQDQITSDKRLSTCLREVILKNKSVLNKLSSSDIVTLVKDDNICTRKVLETGFFKTLFKTDILNKLTSQDLKKLLIAQPDIAPLVFKPKKTFFGIFTYLNIANKLSEHDLFSVVVNNKEVTIKLLEESKQVEKLAACIESNIVKIEQLGEKRFDLLFALFEHSKLNKKSQAFHNYEQLFDLFSKDNLDASIRLNDFTENWLKNSLTTISLNEHMKAKRDEILTVYKINLTSVTNNESSDSDSDDELELQRKNSAYEEIVITSPPKISPVTPDETKSKMSKDKEKISNENDALTANKNQRHVLEGRTNQLTILESNLKP